MTDTTQLKYKGSRSKSPSTRVHRQPSVTDHDGDDEDHEEKMSEQRSNVAGNRGETN
jgi:hypothetical protein